ncbi:MAG: CHAT domain-containing protein [Bacteroidaceae bacterium]|nr:CHAT domain-containing protein [Bacteroidaceae bacterium]
MTFVRSDDDDENKALGRSGLFMAGASSWFYGETIPNHVNDGIVTAREIAHLDLTSMNLVVLSACETGLGDITGDGVFGLQRGFKKAGVQSIVMSLWKVDDEATRLLMVEFYTNLVVRKQSKRQALVNAQHYLRTYGDGRYAHPRYWAAFILLDGID